MLDPLRQSADRTVSQIERFAQNLDRFKRHSFRPNDPETSRAAHDLAKRFQKIAENCAQDLSPQVIVKKAKQLFSTNVNDEPPRADDASETALRWRIEAETWELLANLLTVTGPRSEESAKQAQRTALSGLHRYSSDREVWDRFLEVDSFAKECVVVLNWLEKTARGPDHSGLEGIVKELEEKSGRGTGLSAAGWLYTKEKIKAHKRLSSLAHPLDQDFFAVKSLTSLAMENTLASQLDPDAATRQHTTLLPEDQFHEKAAWISLWRMLRQGHSWEKAKEWAAERLETWRAASVYGTSAAYSHGTPNDSSARMMTIRSQDSWRSACSVLANNPELNTFERAVYALLCGETEPAYTACQSWSDHLYVYLNHVVISRYRDFCRQFHRALTTVSLDSAYDSGVAIEPADYTAIKNFLESVRVNERVRLEAANPYRTIQSAIICKSYDDFFHKQAAAMCKAAVESKQPTLVPQIPDVPPVDASATMSAKDVSSLRIAAHLFPLAYSLGYLNTDEGSIQMASIGVIGYISHLQKVNEVDFAPLYASILPEEMTHVVLGKVLVGVTDASVRNTLITRMRLLRMNTMTVLDRQWEFALAQADSKTDQKPITLKRSIIRPPEGGPLRMGPIGKNFIGTKISPESENLIRSVDWRRYAEGQWEKICQHGTSLYKRFLMAGQLAEARGLLNRAPLSKLSLDSLGYDVTELHGSEMDLEDDIAQSLDEDTPTKKEDSRNDLYNDNPMTENAENKPSELDFDLQKIRYRQSRNMYNLEQLVGAFDSLESYGKLLDEHEKLSSQRGTWDTFQNEIDSTLELVTERVNPLFSIDWLANAQDATEKTELDFIRGTYLPEIVLAYHNALYNAGVSVSPEYFTQCMSLATTVAQTPVLTSCFVASERMRELVDAFAISSLGLVNATSRESNKKNRGNMNLEDQKKMDIWTVKGQEEQKSSLF